MQHTLTHTLTLPDHGRAARDKKRAASPRKREEAGSSIIRMVKLFVAFFQMHSSFLCQVPVLSMTPHSVSSFTSASPLEKESASS